NGLNVTQEFYKIIVDKHNPDILYLACEQEGVFISYTAGESWEAWNEGLTNTRAGSSGNNIANPMAISADGRYLYLGTFGSGVFRRTIYIPPTIPTTTTTTTTPFTPPPIDDGIFFGPIVIALGAATVLIVIVAFRKMRKS
ncbi:MAG: hypothetical protein ACFFFO_15180, partial [Candidatus Thorarchaeota archaeon]